MGNGDLRHNGHRLLWYDRDDVFPLHRPGHDDHDHHVNYSVNYNHTNSLDDLNLCHGHSYGDDYTPSHDNHNIDRYPDYDRTHNDCHGDGTAHHPYQHRDDDSNRNKHVDADDYYRT